MRERKLSNLTEDRESRRVLDDFYDQVLQYCLEQGMWKFAMRRTNLAQTGSGQYGFTFSFDKPSDFIHLFVASENADFDPPLVYNFVDEGSVFYANANPLRIRYSSNGSSFGANLAAWPQIFTEYVAKELAAWSSYTITGNERIAVMLDQKAKLALANALSLYSLTTLPGYLPLNIQARTPVQTEEANFHPELLPYGSDVKALVARQNDSERG